MVNIISDDALVESRLRNLVKLAIEHGAFFHSDITIVSTEGDLRIDSTLDRTNGDPLIYLTDNCLPRIDDFEVGLDGDDLIYKPISSKVSYTHIEFFENILELFNLTNKIQIHRKTFPWLVFMNNKNILEHLYRGRSLSDKYYNHFKAGELERLAVETFIGARFINHAYQDGHGMKSALMPVIDCLNHHSFANTYLDASPDPAVKEGLMVRNSKPDESTDECFVRYNKADALSSYMSYGFVDMSTTILRSIPMKISLLGTASIHVHAYTLPKDTSNIPSDFEDIKYFFPDIRRTSIDELQVSYLMIPPESAPRALRRILEFLIIILSPTISKKELKRLVRKSESQLIDTNEDYYNELKQMTNSARHQYISTANKTMLNQLINSQLGKIQAYKKRRLK